MSFVLCDNIRSYYAYYLQSVIGDSASIPIFTRRVEATRAYLERMGYVINSEHSLSQESMTCADELNELIDREQWEGIASFYQRYSKGKSVRSGAYIVGVGRSAGLGVLRALSDGRDFVAVGSLRDEALSKLYDVAQSIYIVMEELTDQDASYIINRSQEISKREALIDVSIGFLHGRTFETMTLLDAKQRMEVLTSANHELSVNVIVDSFLTEAPQEKADDLVVKPYLELNKGAITDRDSIHVLSITSHGMSDLIHLNADFICGKSPFLGIDPYTTNRLPSCMEDGGFCLFKRNGSPLHGYEIKASHVFINSCGSLRFLESTFDPLFNIGYSMLEGFATSFVGALRWKDGHGSESLLYYHLLKAGFSIGEAVAILNRALLANQFENSSNVFGLIGDPEARPFESPSNMDCYEITDYSERVKVNIKNGFSHVKLISPELTEGYLNQKIFLYVKDKTTYYITCIPTRDKTALHIFLYSYEHRNSEIDLEIEDFNQTFTQILHKYHLIDQNLNNTLGLNKLYPYWIKQGGKKNLENRLLNISRLYKSYYTNNGIVNKLLNSSRKFIAEVDKIDFDIAKALYDSVSSTSFRFSEYYQENFFLQPGEAEHSCYICGNKLILRTLKHILRPDVQRTEAICTNCGGIEDKPDHAISLQIDFNAYFVRGSKSRVNLKLQNHSHTTYDGYCLVSIRKSSEFELRPIMPIQKITIPPHESNVSEFEIVVGADVPIHQYSMQAAFITTSQIYLGGRGFWVITEASNTNLIGG